MVTNQAFVNVVDDFKKPLAGSTEKPAPNALNIFIREVAILFSNIKSQICHWQTLSADAIFLRYF